MTSTCQSLHIFALSFFDIVWITMKRGETLHSKQNCYIIEFIYAED